VQEELPARRVSEPAPGRFVFDVGQNMVGWVRLKVTGKAGQKVTLRHGEMLNPNGTLYTSNLRGATATDVFWLRDGEQTLEPWGTLHGFRYVEVTGIDGPPALAAVTGLVVHNPMARTGDFSCSSPLVNQLFKNIIWGQRGNYLEAPTDCPQRDERLGWTGDTQFFIRTGLFNFEAPNFIERWLVTLATDSQGADGTFTDTAPAIGHKPHAVTAWGDAAIVVTHALWLVYGDTRVIERHFDELARYLAALRGVAKDGIVKIGGYGDWLNKGGGAKTEVMDTAYYAHLAGLMSEMARAIGREADAAKFAEEQRAVTAAWRREFLKPDGSILESSQTGFALAFTMGLLPDDLKAAAAEKFVADIAGRDWHLATGFIGTPRLLPALHAAGRDDVAYRLLLQESYPSWLFQVKLGATTMWERWDGWTPEQGFQSIGMNSFNHYAFGAVAEYLYRFVGGIDTDGPGFRRIVLAPQPGGGLHEAHASYESINGAIASSWDIQGGKLTLEVHLPPNTSGTVRVPSGNPRVVYEGPNEAAKAPGVQFVRAEPGGAVFRVGSGTYRFMTAAP
jgi:alpha-L-rhamnosidase